MGVFPIIFEDGVALKQYIFVILTARQFCRVFVRSCIIFVELEPEQQCNAALDLALVPKLI
jgi:hypothetical protein